MSLAKGVTEVDGVTEYKYFAGGEWRSAEGNRVPGSHLDQLPQRPAPIPILNAAAGPPRPAPAPSKP
jgi:hypothetical protein